MPFRIEPSHTVNNVAVSFDGYILVFWGNITDEANCSEIWAYSTETEVWRKYELNQTIALPPDTICACAVTIDDVIYMFGGLTVDDFSNSVWQLKIVKGHFIWTEILIASQSESPSPRMNHSGWEHGGKLWVFAGYGSDPQGYLNTTGNFVYNHGDEAWYNNQLLHFEPGKGWSNLRCTGRVPPPGDLYRSADIGNKAWILGGIKLHENLIELYELDTTTISWTYIHTTQLPFKVRMDFSFTAITDHQIVLHGGTSPYNPDYRYDTWWLDVSTLVWTKYNASRDHQRVRHTGVKGRNNRGYIIGGYPAQRDVDYNPVFHIMLEPKSLKVLALNTVYEHQDFLPWRQLPYTLQRDLFPMQDLEETEN